MRAPRVTARCPRWRSRFACEPFSALDTARGAGLAHASLSVSQAITEVSAGEFFSSAEGDALGAALFNIVARVAIIQCDRQGSDGDRLLCADGDRPSTIRRTIRPPPVPRRFARTHA